MSDFRVPENAYVSVMETIEEVEKDGKKSFKITLKDHDVMFPFLPYKSQVIVMDMIINACSRQQHCLIESPTGSGKTLALLVGALTWQKNTKAKLDEERINWEKAYAEHCMQVYLAERMAMYNKPLPMIPNEECPKESFSGACCTFVAESGENSSLPVTRNQELSEVITISSEEEREEESFSDEDVFKTNKGKREYTKPKSHTQIKRTKNETLKTMYPTSPVKGSFENQNGDVPTTAELPTNTTESFMATSDSPTKCATAFDSKTDDPSNLSFNSPYKTKRFPKIFYATRTHQQIDQVVKQLRLSDIDNIKMTVLASRDRACIHPKVVGSFSSEKSELCNRLTALKIDNDKELCEFYLNKDTRFGNHKKLEETGCANVWDIEDLVKMGKNHTACPYYGARSLMASADIIFCPYNYLISPLIRKSMSINLSGHVLIFDEAHNIDDVCRESASYKLHENVLTQTISECSLLSYSSSSYDEIVRYLQLLMQWTREKWNSMTFNDYNKAETVLSVTEFVAAAENSRFGKEEFLKFLNAFTASLQDGGHLTSRTKACIEGLIFVLSYIFNLEYQNDFSIVVEKNLEDEFSSGQSHSRKKKCWNSTVNFLCLNSATIFNDIKNEARSIILTSGTLSPLESFDAELGLTFELKAELSNEISSKQLFASVVSQGRNGVLTFDFANMNSYDRQDDVGRLLLIISQIVPGGILVFFPSYAAKDNMYRRWNDSGMLEQISKHKTFFQEPRTVTEMKDIMTDYCAANRDKGALMLAVFRGKVSEGINFENEHARAVIAIGIPYPNFKAVDVRLKRSFNDRFSSLKGSEWYSMQGFRALNQALGRVIRHKDDWGIILLVDNRYNYDTSKRRLSKWIRDNVQQPISIIPSLKKFCDSKKRHQQSEENQSVENKTG